MALESKPDLVVLDLILPKKDGFKVLRELKQREGTKHIPVIVLSNLENSENIELAVRLGAHSYLMKPNYDIAQVAEKLSAVLADKTAAPIASN